MPVTKMCPITEKQATDEGAQIFIDDMPGDDPVAWSHGTMDYTCAKCERVVFAKMSIGQIGDGIVVKCRCGQFNEIPEFAR